MGVLKLAERYSSERLEAACKKALSYTASPSYKSIKSILEAGKAETAASEEVSGPANPYAITRGADYYRR